MRDTGTGRTREGQQMFSVDDVPTVVVNSGRDKINQGGRRLPRLPGELTTDGQAHLPPFPKDDLCLRVTGALQINCAQIGWQKRNTSFEQLTHISENSLARYTGS